MFYSIVVALLLGLLSVFPPYFGFLYTTKIIKEFKNRGIKKGFIIFFISILGIFSVFSLFPLMSIFFSVYIVSIIGYFILEKYSFEKWDKIMMISLLSMFLIMITYYFNKDFFISIKNSMMEQIFITMSKIEPNMTKIQILKMYEDFFKELPKFSFLFIFISNLFTYSILNKKILESKISYVYILGFIGVYLLNKFYKIDNSYTKNLIEVIKYIYIIYGIKECFYLINKKLKMKFFSIGITMFIYSIHPAIFFIFGSLMSFKTVNIEKED